MSFRVSETTWRLHLFDHMCTFLGWGSSEEDPDPHEVQSLCSLPRASLGVQHEMTVQVYLKLLLQFLLYPVCHMN